MTTRYDCIVIGSGFGGAITAARLAEGGMKVLLLERGQRRTSRELKQTDDPADIADVIDFVVSSSNIAYRTGKLLGGASINMDGAFYRIPTFVFERKENGRRLWPETFTRKALDPYYKRVETRLHIRQRRWDEIPKGGGLFAKMLANAGAHVDRTPMNYLDCRQCGYCAVGCTFNKKVTLLHSYLKDAAALATPIEILTGVQIDRVEAGYTAVGTKDGAPFRASADRMIIACGGMHSAALLLRSKATIGALSDEVGRHFNTNGDHPYIGILPEGFDDLTSYHCYKGMENSGVMCFEWLESDGITWHPGGGIEPAILASAFSATPFGIADKAFARSVYPHRIIGFELMGLVDSYQRIVLDAKGAPDVVLDGSRSAFDAYLTRADTIIRAAAAKSGVTLYEGVSREYAGMTAAHLLSACRMADSAANGVVDADCRVFGHDNLYLCDASVIPGALAVNPAHTIGALAERTADKILERG